MKIIQVTSFISNYRFTLDRSLELSKYIDVKWYVGWFWDETFEYEGFCNNKHNIVLMGSPKTKKRRIKGMIAQILYTLRVGRLLKKEEAAIVIIHSYSFAFLYPIIAPKHNYVLQLYTTSVSTSNLKNWFWNTWEGINQIPYDRYFVGTPELIDLFKIKKTKKVYVTRSGMKPLSKQLKDFTSVRLLYLGVLGPSRRIDDTLHGLRIFLDRNPSAKISYDIIGSAKPEDMQLIRDTIINLKLENFVTYHGYLPDENIIKFFDECNVGVSYVPITSYYTDVSVTKTMEYMLSGIPVVATKTNWHLDKVNEVNGILIDDSAESFAEGLEALNKELSKFDSLQIMESAKEWDLTQNVKNRIVPLIKKIVNNPKDY